MGLCHVVTLFQIRTSFLRVFVMLLQYFIFEQTCFDVERNALLKPFKNVNSAWFQFQVKNPSCWLIFTHSDPGSHVSTRSAHFSAFMFRVFESNWNLMVLLSKIHAVCTVACHSLLCLWQLLKSCKLCDTV